MQHLLWATESCTESVWRNGIPYQLLDLCLFEVKFRIYVCNNRRRRCCVLCVSIVRAATVFSLILAFDVRTLTACSHMKCSIWFIFPLQLINVPCANFNQTLFSEWARVKKKSKKRRRGKMNENAYSHHTHCSANSTSIGASYRKLYRAMSSTLRDRLFTRAQTKKSDTIHE